MGSNEGTQGKTRRSFRFFAILLAAAGLVASGCEEEEPPLVKSVDAATPDSGAADRAPGDGGGDAVRNEAGEAGPMVTLPLTILHTNDLHSHLWGHSPEADYTPATLNDDLTVGGFARLATAIRTQRAAAGADVLLLDGGDFLMGTPFHLAATTSAPELRLMQAAGYDAAAIGNHEFDFAPRGLAAVLAAARTAGVTLPLLASNLKFSTVSADDDTLAAFAAGSDPLVRTKLVKTLPGGLKVGLFGLLGPEAQRFAPLARPVTFEDYAVTARAMVADLRDNDKVDLVIALSHSGINAQGMGEDRNLAMMVQGIDVIVSGHSHDRLMIPAVVNKTIIVTAGSRGEFLGRLDLEVIKQGTVVSDVRVKEGRLIKIDDAIAGDTATQTAVDMYVTGLDMALAPLSYKKVVGETTFDVTRASMAESAIGDLVADAFLARARALEPLEPADFAVEANGQIRADLLKGKTGQLWFSDLFQVTPLHAGPDGKPGTPLISFYLTGLEVLSVLEVGAAATTLGDTYFLQVAGIEVDYRASSPLFQRVTGARIVREGMAPRAVESGGCYKVVSTLYVGAFFGLVESLTQGARSIKPKAERECQMLVTDLTTRRIDARPDMPEVQEIKQYQAVLQLVSGFPDTDTDLVPNFPAQYMAPQQRLKPVQ